MIARVVRRFELADTDSVRDDLEDWLSRRPEERIAAVELLRRRHHGDSARLQRSARVADLEALGETGLP